MSIITGILCGVGVVALIAVFIIVAFVSYIKLKDMYEYRIEKQNSIYETESYFDKISNNTKYFSGVSDKTKKDIIELKSRIKKEMEKSENYNRVNSVVKFLIEFLG